MFNGPINATPFNGSVASFEVPRLQRQHEVIRNLMLDGRWRTLGQIELLTGFPQASVSAQLRHLRKPRFGSYFVEKRRVTETGLWEYRISAPEVSDAA